MNKPLTLGMIMATGLVLTFIFTSPIAESVPDRATETTQLLLLEQLVNVNSNIQALNSDIDVLNNRVIITNTLEEANFQTFAIDGVSDRFFVQNVSTTNNDCDVFDKAFQTLDRITCIEPFLSLTTPQRLDYNANYTLP